MKRRACIVTAFAILLTGAAWWYLSIDRDTRLIRRALSELHQQAAFSGPETPLQAAVAAKALGAYFTRDVRFDQDVVPIDIRDRRSLEAAIVRARIHAEALSLTARDVRIVLSNGKRSARVRYALRGDVRADGTRDAAWREIEQDWVKTDHGWRISRLRVTRSITPVP